jgi:C4-type Zn-finger protein
MCLCHICLVNLTVTSHDIKTAFGKKEIVEYRCKKCGYIDFVVKSKEF